jgi:hypothetical protein
LEQLVGAQEAAQETRHQRILRLVCLKRTLFALAQLAIQRQREPWRRR